MTLRNLTDKARVTGVIEPAENDGWRIGTRIADTAYGDSFGSVIRTGRGQLEEGATYTMLYRKHEWPERSTGVRQESQVLVMSDTPDEMRDLLPILIHGEGRVLVNGLGLGCVVRGLLAKDEVEHVDVVEISRDLIDLVGPYYDDERVTIHEADAFTIQWPKGMRWDAVWHDVWDDLSTANLSDEDEAKPGTYAKLHRRYGRRCKWQGSWGREFLEHQRGRFGW